MHTQGLHQTTEADSFRSIMSLSEPEFGPFEAAFDCTGLDVPGYLTLLNLRGEDPQIVISRIADALGQGDARNWVSALLADFNWRPHLVAAIAFLLDQRKSLDPAALWPVIDAGSWVTPQLVVTAFFSDPSFATNAFQRMDEGCPVCIPPGLDPLVRHIATGPSGPTGRSGKMAASILALCDRVPALAAREDEWRAAPMLQGPLAEDHRYDRSDQITKAWMASVSAHFAKRGIHLSPA